MATGHSSSNDNWGQAARFGIFIVGAEVVPEAEWWAMAPDGVSIHAARVSAPAPWADFKDGKVTLGADLQRGATQFASMALSAVVVAHSSSSVMGGPGWDAAVIDELKRHVHPDTQVTTNGLDCTLALRACGVKRPLVVFPPWFGPSAIQAGGTYFSIAGFDDVTTMQVSPGPDWEGVAPGDLYKRLMHIRQDVELLFKQIVADCPEGADGVLIAGTGLRSVGVIERLEAALGRPVITANQASLWRCLGLSGVETPVPGYGRLLRDPR